MERIEKHIVVQNTHGLHVRPAGHFVQLANKFDSWVILEKDGEKVDGKSIVAILSLGVQTGASIKLVVEGSDAAEAFEELRLFLENIDD